MMRFQARNSLLLALFALCQNVVVQATISVKSTRQPSISGVYVRGVELMGGEGDEHEGRYYIQGGNHRNLWLFRKTMKLEGDETGHVWYRWLIGEDLVSSHAMAFVDVPTKDFYLDEPPCDFEFLYNEETDSTRSTALPTLKWMVSTGGGWEHDTEFEVICHGMDPGGIDSCTSKNTVDGQQSTVPCIELNGKDGNKISMPTVMLGTAYIGINHGAGQENPDIIEPPPAIELAIDLGYQGLDLGSQLHPAYANEQLVGDLLKKRPGRRKSLFLTTKLSPSEHGYQATLRGVQRSLRLLQTDTIDLFLIHHPRCLMVDQCEGDWIQSWRAMEALFHTGAIRAVGVSNFDAPLLRELMDVHRDRNVPVALVQNRADPLAPEDPAVLDLCHQHGIAYQAFSVLGRQWVVGPWSHFWHKEHPNHPILTHPDVAAIAERLTKQQQQEQNSEDTVEVITPAQVILRWAYQKGWNVIPKTASRERLESNRRLFHFELTIDDMNVIDHLTPPPKEKGDEL
jgi:diketogulonate reductase-like aldo/keto reductase